MKKIILLILALILSLSPLAVIPTAAEEATETEGESIINHIAIKSEEDFLAMEPNGAYYLANDITISSSYENEFSGTLHGNDNKIKFSNNATPFKKLKGATIIGLTVIGSITVNNNENRGGIANEGSASFKNVTSDVEISTTNSFTSLSKSIGGFIGYVDATSSFVNCTNKGDLNILSQQDGSTEVMGNLSGVGGFVGSVFVTDTSSVITIENCNNNAEVYSTQYALSAGGFIGYASNASIIMTNCVNTKAVTGSAYYNDPSQHHKGVAGILGTVEANANPDAKIVLTNVENQGNVRGIDELTMTGGIIGMLRDCANVTLYGCKNSGSISCERSIWEGGAGIIAFVSGSTKAEITFIECSNSGHVKAFEAGGLLGFVQNTVPSSTFNFERCFNIGTIEATSMYAGGMIGQISTIGGKLNISNCVNTGHIEVLKNTGGGAGGIVGFIEKLEYSTISHCVNTGSIRCNNNTYTQVGYYCAAGIISRFCESPATVSSCVNAGATSHAAVSQNNVAICYNYEPLGHSIALNVYLNGTGNGNIGARGFDFYIIAESAAIAITSGYAESDYHSAYGVDAAYTETKKATTTSELGNAAIRLLTKINELQTNEEYLAALKQEKLAKLGEKIFYTSYRYDAECYKNYSKAFDDIVLAITSAEDVDTLLNEINVQDMLAEANALLTLNTEVESPDVTDETEAPTVTDVTEGTDTEQTTPATDEQVAKTGCKSVVASSTAILLSATVICGALVKRKKED